MAVSALLLGFMMLNLTSCSKDEDVASQQENELEENPGGEEELPAPEPVEDIVLTVDADGKADGGHHFTKIDETNCYIDGIKYTEEDGSLVVSGYKQESLHSVSTIISQLNYNGRQLHTRGIAKGAFENCNIIKSIIIPSSVKSIGERAFFNCKEIRIFIIGSGLRNLESHAFAACTSLVDFVCSAKAVPKIEAANKDIFEYSNIYDATLHTPMQYFDKYKSTYPWSSFGKFKSFNADVDEDEDLDRYVCPVFGTLQQNPSPAKPGEEVTLTFDQNRKGNGIFSTTYEWTICNLVSDDETGQLTDLVLSVHTNYDGDGKQPPTLTFKVPENCFSGTYTVNLKAYFAIYLGGKLYDETSTSGTLVVQ